MFKYRIPNFQDNSCSLSSSQKKKKKAKRKGHHPPLLTLVISSALDLPLLLECLDNVLVLPSDLGRDAADGGVLATRTEAQNAESGRNDHTLDTVVRRRDTLKELEAVERCGTARGLVRQHAAQRLVKETGRRAEMEGATNGVDNAALAEVSVVLDYFKAGGMVGGD